MRGTPIKQIDQLVAFRRRVNLWTCRGAYHGMRGDTLGPTSAMMAGFGNAGPETAVAEAPYQQQQYLAGGTTALENENENGRDFGYAQRSQSAGVGQEGHAPDRYSLGGEGPRQRR